MGFLRVFNIGLVTGIRNKKRTVPMVILFTILFSIVTYQLVKVNSYSTDALTYTRGIIITANGDVPGSTAYNEISNMYSAVDNYVQAVFVVYYVELIPGTLGMITVKAFEGHSGGYDWRWVLDETKPSKIVIGRHIQARGEAIVNSGYSIQSVSNGMEISQKVGVVGFDITIARGEKSKTLKVVGLYNTTRPGYQQLAGTSKNLLVVSWEDFKEIVEDIWPSGVENAEKADYVYTRRVIFFAKGDLFSGTISKNLDSAKNTLSTHLSGNPDFSVENRQNVDPAAFRSDLTWSVTTILIAIVLAFIYAFIIVRFKGRDIATLRALGWRRRDVLAYSFGEFFLIIITGYILGVFLLWLYNLVMGVNLIMSSETLGISFGITIIGLLFGYFIVSRRVSAISPIKAFREA
ncbi:MAG: ABC transporter permease [Candidatus Njordarchaeia archaeon]